MTSNQQYLQHALKLADSRRGFCAPNPAVGALLVKDGEIIAEGCHFAAGQPHAEINAIQQAGNNAAGASLYVTLEPCCHQGRTPPCVDAIIKAKIAEVYFAYRDPNPSVSGKGQEQLIQAGIPTHHVTIDEIDRFYQSYQHWTKTHKPWVTIKLAVSKDNKIAYQDGSPAVITGTEAKDFTHQCRLKADAILTTINTVQNDDPQLNVRLNNKTIAKNIYILDSRLQLPKHASIHNSAQNLTVFFDKTLKLNNQLRSIGITTTDQGLDLNEVIAKIGEDGVHNLWVEAGAKCFQALVQTGLADEIYLYQSPIELGVDAKPAMDKQFDITQFYKELASEPSGADLIRHFIKSSV